MFAIAGSVPRIQWLISPHRWLYTFAIFNFGFPGTEVSRDQRLRLYFAADGADDFCHLPVGQSLWLRQTLLAADGRRQRSLRLLCHRNRFADRPSRQQGKRHLDHDRQLDWNRADGPSAGPGRRPLRQRHAPDIRSDWRHRPIGRPSRRRRQTSQ